MINSVSIIQDPEQVDCVRCRLANGPLLQWAIFLFVRWRETWWLTLSNKANLSKLSCIHWLPSAPDIAFGKFIYLVWLSLEDLWYKDGRITNKKWLWDGGPIRRMSPHFNGDWALITSKSRVSISTVPCSPCLSSLTFRVCGLLGLVLKVRLALNLLLPPI